MGWWVVVGVMGKRWYDDLHGEPSQQQATLCNFDINTRSCCTTITRRNWSHSW